MTRSPEWSAANHGHLAAALDELAGRLDPDSAEPVPRTAWTLPEPPALDALRDGFGLSGFERDVLLLCAGVELDTGFAHSCAKAHGEPGRTWASFGLALSTLDSPHWDAISPAGPLRACRLVTLTHPESPTAGTLRIEERVLHALTGLDYLDPAIAALSAPPPPAATGHPAAATLARQWADPSTPHVVVLGRHRADLLAIAATASARAGLRPVVLDGADLPRDVRPRNELAALCERESTLTPTAWVLDLVEADEPAHLAAVRFAGRLSAPVAIIAPRPPPGPALPRISVPAASVAERVLLWRDVADRVPVPEVTRLAAQFDLDADTVRAVVSEARAAGQVTVDDLWRGCQSHARPGIDAVAQRVESRAGWADIVLPAHQSTRLHRLVAHVRHRHLVLDGWGFAGARGLGTAALFAGPSGTGKTLAAEVVAGELHLDLYRVDLSRVISKYVGETEKNLSRVFDAADAGGAVLLFDEADALFGKRGEVTDSRDRYANIEVGYLLQRIESYRGLAILTTNLKDSLDPAFQRRLRFVVDFPFPDARSRAAIWRTAFPAAAPTRDLDHDLLAQLTITGAAIRDTALSAAYLAADAGEAVTMAHVLEAARAEYAKLDRRLTGTEVSGWPT
ncbi:ATP-binding protein [Amycolatopsis sp. NBC_00355]|uniref:ATP-binding protein n=1 Tax=Amycolatopsis sp. NBC_00355 TaxID=2975957 RepID=UPI002E26C027